MVRRPRVEYPGTFSKVIAGGNRGEDIFLRIDIVNPWQAISK